MTKQNETSSSNGSSNETEFEGNLYSTVESPKFAFTFTSYQLSVLAALDAGCSTAAEIREYLETETDGQAGASARRKTYETIACLQKAGLVESCRVGRYRTVSVLPEAAEFIHSTLQAAGLAS